ncbi:MFS transporter [Pedobacter sp. AW1-32]|uniref:MFS transporter n=1 Tax=Pedobacter sp. AW1-32 TaxID=3383026 RepID=UPI003FED4B1E
MNRMSALQYGIIFLCFVMNMCDGMDVMAVSYTAKEISTEWGVSPKTFGLVFSAGLIGMGLGALILAPLADRAGRKALILISLSMMGITSLLTSLVDSMAILIAARVLTGLGLGCLLACINVLAAEYSSAKNRNFWVSFVGSGYPAGAMLSGFFADYVIIEYGWRAFYVVVGVLTLLVVPLVMIFIRESFDFLLKKQPKNALERLNKIYRSMHVEELKALPPQNKVKSKSSILNLFSKGLKRSTIIMWAAFFCCFGSFYFLTSWIPKLASDFGFSDVLAIYAGLIFSLGSMLGVLSQGYLSTKLGIKGVIGFYLIVGGVLMSLFGLFTNQVLLLCLFACIGFGIQGGLIGLYAISVNVYPPTIRSTGIGWAIGMGRFGAILGPIAGGIFISHGFLQS